MKNNRKLPLNIQFFAEDGGTTPEVTSGQNVTNAQPQAIDYDKIQQMIDSRNQKNENAVLKGYFQSQGLSEDEMQTAIQKFKTEKEEKSKQQQVDNENLQNQLKDANAKVLKEQIEKEALMQALELGVDLKTVPYLTKLADFSGVVDDKGTITTDKVKEALSKVLEDVPGLKSKEDDGMKGFKMGANNQQNSNGLLDDTLAKVFGTKK